MRRSLSRFAPLTSALVIVSLASPALAANPSAAQPPIQRPSSRTEAPSADPIPVSAEAPDAEAPEVAAPRAEPPGIEFAPAPDAALAPAPAPADPLSAAPSAQLPGYDAPAPQLDPMGVAPLGADAADKVDASLAKIPSDGRGLLAMSGLFLGAGSVLMLGGGVVLAQGNDSLIPAASVGFGVATTVAGGLFLTGGLVRNRRYRKWEAGQVDRPPRQGTGLVATGATLMSAGSFSLVIGGLGMLSGGLLTDSGEPSPLFPAMVGLGVGAFATGVGTLVAGARRNKSFNTWRHARDTQPVVTEIQPILSFTPTGGQIGLAGRF